MNGSINLDAFDVFDLPIEVITCIEAAKAKGIPLENELKSLVLSTSDGLCLLNITGRQKASLRKVKNILRVDEAFLADNKTLSSLEIKPGTVCPFLPQLWKLPQLISEDLLRLDFVSTNNGTRKGYIYFAPKLLLNAENYIIDKFAQPHEI
jgi:prolyl-tRNA editing enzyme YbaK/EbsC (Cys-tRNA(Pro) deacylase)